MKRTYIYVVGVAALHEAKPPFKIGVSTDIQQRLAALQTGSPVRLQIFHKRLVSAERSPYEHERNLHWLFRAHQIHGEWFNVPLDEVVWAVNAETSGTADPPERPDRPKIMRRRVTRRGRADSAMAEWRQHRRDIGGDR